MRAHLISKGNGLLWVCGLVLLSAELAQAQVLHPPFDAYTFADLGSVPGVPANYGGLTFKPGDGNTLLIGGGANGSSGAIYEIGVLRDPNGYIIGFNGTATLYSGAAYIDGGLDYFGGILFYTRYNINEVGQVVPGELMTRKTISLSPHVTGSVGGLKFVPSGLPGAGQLKLASYNTGNWYSAQAVSDGMGTYNINNIEFRVLVGGGPEGIAYVPPNSPHFNGPSVLISEYINGMVVTWEVDNEGDPIPGTRKLVMSQLGGAEGAVIDPVRGDFLFSTYGGGNRVIAIRGFAVPLAPRVTAWRIIGAHSGEVGDLPITLHPTRTGNGSNGGTIESRLGGVRKIEIDFDMPVQVIGALQVLDQGTMLPIQPNSVTLSDDRQRVTLQFAASAITAGCFSLNVSGVVSGEEGQPISGDTDVHFRVLVGDSNGDGAVSLIDFQQVKGRVGSEVTEAGARYDVNRDGAQSLIDVQLIKSRIGQSVTCP